MRVKSDKCSKCRTALRHTNGRYCRLCKNAYMRSYRSTHPISESDRIKGIARSYLHTYVKRGKVEKKPCRICGSLEVQAHHPNYAQPLLVDWLCIEHHRAEHKKA